MGATSSSAPRQGSNAPWPSFFNPWTGTIAMYPGPRPSVAPAPAASPDGAAAPHQHALVAQQLTMQAQQQAMQAPFPLVAQHPYYGVIVQQFYYGSAPPPQAPAPGSANPTTGLPSSWDQQSLASTFSTMTL